MTMQKEIKQCRICGNKNLIPILSLGNMALGGRFPKSVVEEIPSGELALVKCEEGVSDTCGLLQLQHTSDLREMYGINYGYMSHLNKSMVDHLNYIVKTVLNKVDLQSKDIILDIGSNDGTLLKMYPQDKYELAGIDSCGEQFKYYYPDGITFIPDFFSKEVYKSAFGSRKAKIITSIAMFYDLEAPMEMMKDISDILDDQGVWIVEQSYMPDMIKNIDYTTICHEHIEYYRLKQFTWMTRRCGLKIIDIQFNQLNGGSFVLVIAKDDNNHPEIAQQLNGIAMDEMNAGMHTIEPYNKFKEDVQYHPFALKEKLSVISARGKSILGYGASTKGNTLLQYCGINKGIIPAIGEVNSAKFGCYTPGTLIPIVPEEVAHQLKPDYFLVLPWHFKDFIIEKEREFIDRGGKFIFPLPEGVSIYPCS